MSDLPELETFARKEGGFSKEEGADVVIQEYERFSIDDARALKELAALKSVSGRSLFLVATPSIGSDAQQALLKLFEEPQQGAIFVLLVPHGILLSTLKSRCLPFPIELSHVHSDARVSSFLKASYKERQEQIVEMLKYDEGVRERVREFLNNLEQALYKKLSGLKDTTEIADNLSDIARFRSYLSDRAPSLKMMLEHLAASVPKL